LDDRGYGISEFTQLISEVTKEINGRALDKQLEALPSSARFGHTVSANLRCVSYSDRRGLDVSAEGRRHPLWSRAETNGGSQSIFGRCGLKAVKRASGSQGFVCTSQESYRLAGEWVAGTGAALLDPVLGEELARVSSSGVDLAKGFDFARDVGGSALRALTYGDRGGSLVSSIYSRDPDFTAAAALELASSHSRIHAISPSVATTHTGHGNVMPMSIHWGPGRAGEGEELGGLRGAVASA
jgi:hypothetical protein